MVREQDFAADLIDFIHTSPSPFHVAANIKATLLDEGFQPLELDERWSMSSGDKFFVTRNDSAILAFVVGDGDVAEEGFRLIGSHTDSPSFRVKPDPEMVVEDAYLKLNTEVYGSPIYSTWMDRPLSLAGRVSLRADDLFRPESRFVWFDDPVLIIPNESLHQNRRLNEGVELNPQEDLLPLLASVDEVFEKDQFLASLLADRLGVNLDQVIDFDLFLTEYEKGRLAGLEQGFISSTKLDNLAMVHASMHAFVASGIGSSTNLLVCYDNEEVGSRTKQGAASPFLSTLLERIVIGLGKDREDFYRAIHNSFLVSADMGHAVHPNAVKRHDPVNKPVLNGGPMIKVAAKKNFTTDSSSAAVFKGICDALDIPVQTFVSRSDQKGGSTIGPITTMHLDMRSLDVGNPTLAMHSIRELVGVLDHDRMREAFEGLYSAERLPNAQES